jgi:hypothetical protein
MLHKLDPANIAMAPSTNADSDQRNGREWKSWAIMRNPSKAERDIWSKKDVQVCDADIGDVVAALKQRLAGLSLSDVGG